MSEKRKKETLKTGGLNSSTSLKEISYESEYKDRKFYPRHSEVCKKTQNMS